jgi:glycosyltransferase involved in cell wall biosynthesis
MAHFDIIIPAYNGAKFLSSALESVIQQTYPDWRIILVNDGSTDETPAIGKAFQQRLGPKMLFISQENRGLSASRNIAIQHSTAPLLALLDADDIWLPNRLEASRRCFENNQVGLSYGFVSLIDIDGNILHTQNLQDQLDDGCISSAIYTRSVNLPCPTISFRRQCISEVGGFDEDMRASEDRDLWLRIALKYEVARIPEVIALYRVSSGSMSDDLDRMFRAQLKFIEKHRVSSAFSIEEHRLAVSSVYRQHAETFGQRGRYWMAFEYAVRAFLTRPSTGNLRAAIRSFIFLPRLLMAVVPRNR